jgi:DNA mismatch endonuclease (patch repair protein)
MIPYPLPSSPAVSAAMRGNRRRDTKPELRIRSILHAQGLRYRVDFPITLGDVRVRPDIVFTKQRVAVFVDGCFFHACPEHGTQPKRNVDYWQAKLQRNIERDRRVSATLRAADWTVVRIWEHEPWMEAVALVVQAVRRASGSPNALSS